MKKARTGTSRVYCERKVKACRYASGAAGTGGAGGFQDALVDVAGARQRAGVRPRDEERQVQRTLLDGDGGVVADR